MPKKWIRQRIEELDAERDYAEIWRLSTGYGINEFMSQLMYVLVFQNFIVTEWGSEVIWREDGGKVLQRPYHRAEQTQGANFLWWFHGPEDERTRKSVDAINRLHAYWAKRFPGRFSYNEDYVYVAAFTAVNAHRFRKAIGAPDISEKEKVAAHKFWGEMTKLFFAENGEAIHGYPEDFQGLIQFCEQYEGTPRPKPERTNLIVTLFHDQFVHQFFPPDLHWLGHQLLRSLSLPATLETASIDPPLPPAKDILPKMLGLVLWHEETFKDDPPVSYFEELAQLSPEKKAERRATLRELDTSLPPLFRDKAASDPKWVGCPFHAALSSMAPVLESKEETELSELERVSYPITH